MMEHDFESRGFLAKVVRDPSDNGISGYVANMNKAGLSFRGDTIAAAKAL